MEQLVLSLLLRRGAQPYIDRLTTDDFADPFHRLVFHLIETGKDIANALVFRREDVRRVTGEQHPSAAFERLFIRPDGADIAGLPWWLHIYVSELQRMTAIRNRVLQCRRELYAATNHAHEWSPSI